jgi:hypothetical protein
MDQPTSFDVAAAHRYFSAHCFNEAWSFIDKPDRSPSDNDDMLDAAHASAWHWRQRPDCGNDKLSVAYWQLARVYALAGEPGRAGSYARRCLELSQGQSPFSIGYAYEALARAAALGQDRAAAREHLANAREQLAQVADAEEREMLRADLDTIEM